MVEAMTGWLSRGYLEITGWRAVFVIAAVIESSPISPPVAATK